MGCETQIPRGSLFARPALVFVVAVMIVALTASVLIVVGCGKSDPEDTARTTTGGEQSSAGVVTSATENVVTPGTAPVNYRSPQGMFAVIWPSGCNMLRTRKPPDAPPDGEFPGDVPTELRVYCDRAGHQNEGCAVHGFYNETAEGGGPPHPRLVIDRIEAIMTTYGVDVTSQTPGSWGSLQGVDVHCGERDGFGELWVRGFLAGPHYYLLIAWSQSGGLSENPVYQTFFDSFRVLGSDDRDQFLPRYR